jgi:hypothetical protein
MPKYEILILSMAHRVAFERRRLCCHVRLSLLTPSDNPAMDEITSRPQLQAYILGRTHADKVKETVFAAEPSLKAIALIC